jgi:hypothetical protein
MRQDSYLNIAEFPFGLFDDVERVAEFHKQEFRNCAQEPLVTPSGTHRMSPCH